MNRYDIINDIIKKNRLKSYLEIGTRDDDCLKRIRCEHKTGVDPDPISHTGYYSNEFFELTSDEFFAQNKREFDIVFIDGLHWSEVVSRDIENSIKCGAKFIVIHDCNPEKESNQEPPTVNGDEVIIPHRIAWNGDVWKAFVGARKLGMRQFTVDSDFGVGVIVTGQPEEPKDFGNVEWKDFEPRKKEMLNLISVDEFQSLIYD